MAKTATGKLVQEYCQKWQDLPSLTLAKMIYKEHSSVFSSIDHVRSLIRSNRGSIGEKMRSTVKGIGRIPEN